MKSIAIDDEALALEVIEVYSEKTPQLSLVKTFRNASTALEFISSHEIDLIFLDINMPEMNGLNFIKNLKTGISPMIIFTTAHSEYTIESYNYRAVDYLLKPIEYERFLKAVNKAHEISILNEDLKRSYRELETQKDLLESQKSIIEIQNRQLKSNSIILETKIVERTSELNQLNSDLIDQNNQLEHFAYVISHNIRSPISSLLGLAHIFDHENVQNPLNGTVIKQIGNMAHKLDETIKEIGQILQIKRNSNDHLSSVSINRAIEKNLEILDTIIKENNVSISLDIEMPDDIYVIPPYLNSILYNLISNAVKYRSNNREAIISIKSRRIDQDKIELLVCDNGIGIDLGKNKDRLFGIYQRFSEHIEGKGLGLYLVKMQLEKMNSEIEVESTLGEGTRFRIIFRNQSLNTKHS